MKNSRLFLSLLSASLLASACVEPVSTEEREPTGQSARQSTTLTLDDSRIYPLPQDLALSQEALDYDARVALSPESMGRVVAQEPMQVLQQDSTRLLAESANFRFEADYSNADVILSRKEGAVLGSPVPFASEDELTQRSLDKMAQLGVKSPEFADVAQRRLARLAKQGRDGTPSTPQVLSHKTFIERRIADIPVLGHRLVVTHDPEGRSKKVFGRWPGLASSGHKLTTAMTREQIRERAYQVLSGEDLPAPHAVLRYVYKPEAQQDGRIVLVLKVEALSFAADQLNPAVPYKHRSFLIDVD